MNNREFQEMVEEKAKEAGVFQPIAIADPDEDTIEFLSCGESYRVERVDALVTVYHGRESDEIIGAKIKKVSELLKRLKDKGSEQLRLEIHGGKVKLVCLLRAIFSQRESVKKRKATIVLVYKKLEELAEAADLETDVETLVEAGSH